MGKVYSYCLYRYHFSSKWKGTSLSDTQSGKIKQNCRKSAKKQATIDMLLKQFAVEKQSQEYLESVRWHEGLCLPQCGCCHGYRLSSERYPCSASITVGTALHKTHMPLTQFYLICQDKRSISVVEYNRDCRKCMAHGSLCIPVLLNGGMIEHCKKCFVPRFYLY